jgi:hypothetical protein
MTNPCNAKNLQIFGLALGLALVGVTPAAMAQGDYGTIKGRLVWGGAEVPKQAVLVEQGKAKSNPELCAKDAPILSKELVVDPKTKGVAHSFAYLVRPKGSNPKLVAELLKKTPKVELDQKNCEFIPHSMAILKGQTIIFNSSDPVSHNIRYSGFNNVAFNSTVPAKSSVERDLVSERVPIPVKCDIHPWMQAQVGIFDHPFFAVTKEDGSFEIKGVPAGAQKIVLWQEKIGFVTPNKGAGKPIDVKAGQVLDLGDITMSK